MRRSSPREWIQINRKRPADYRRDLGIFRASVAFVSRRRAFGREDA